MLSIPWLSSMQELSVLRVVGVFILGYLCYYVGSAIYHLFFHPLRKYPGPCFAKFSNWPIWLHSLRGDRHIWLWQLQQQHGPNFRHCPDGLLLNSPSSFRAISDNRANIGKGSFYDSIQRKPKVYSTFDCTDKRVHAHKRRLLNAAFSDKALRSAEPFVTQHVDRWIDLLVMEGGREWSKPVNIAHAVDFLVLDILGELAFGRALETKEPKDSGLKFLPELFIDFVAFQTYLADSPFLNFWLAVKPYGGWQLLEAMRPARAVAYFDFLEATLKQRSQDEEAVAASSTGDAKARKDFFHYVYRETSLSTGGVAHDSLSELFSECSLLVIAGSDTTSTAFAALFFYLTHYPAVYDKLVSEIRRTFSSLDEIHSGPALSSCVYLRACIDEAMRMNPPIPRDLDRVVLGGGANVEGHYLPAGTRLSSCIHNMHHDPSYFDEPFIFKPERWILDEKAGITQAVLDHQAEAFWPFSSGVRNCPGQKLAYLEMELTIARLLWKVDLKGVDGDRLGAGSKELIWGRRDEGHYQVKDCFISARTGPMVQFKLR